MPDAPPRIVTKPDEVYIGLTAKSQALIEESSKEDGRRQLKPIVLSNAAKSVLDNYSKLERDTTRLVKMTSQGTVKVDKS